MKSGRTNSLGENYVGEVFTEAQNILCFKLEREREGEEEEEERHKETEGIRGRMRAGRAGRLSITSVSGEAAHVSELL